MNKAAELTQKLIEVRSYLAAAQNTGDTARAAHYETRLAECEAAVATHERRYMARGYRKAQRAAAK